MCFEVNWSSLIKELRASVLWDKKKEKDQSAVFSDFLGVNTPWSFRPTYMLSLRAHRGRGANDQLSGARASQREHATDGGFQHFFPCCLIRILKICEYLM